MYLVVAYDVVSDRRRARLHKALSAFLEPVQKSVFEGELRAARFERLERSIVKEIDPTTDTVRVYTLYARSQAATRLFGTSRTTEQEADVVV